MQQRWTCKICGLSYTTDRITYPIHCRCGAVDVGDASKLTPVEPGEIPRGRIPRYSRAVAAWIAAGSPARSDAEVDRIFREHCQPCGLYSNGICMHPNCGCTVRSVDQERGLLTAIGISPALANKIRMATENCPAGKW